MKHLNENTVKKSLIDISQYTINYKNGAFALANDDLLKLLISLVNKDSGYAICYGIKSALKQHNLTLTNKDTAEQVRVFYASIFDTVMKSVDVEKYNVTSNPYDQVGAIDVDGININVGHTPNENTPPRKFITTKCIHFDGCTPYIANIYGPNENVEGGFPVISDTNKYCVDNNVDPRTLVQNIPQNYNVVVKEQHYEAILNDYSFTAELDMEHDMVLTIICNEVTGGVAHAGTTPYKKNSELPALRPIRHIEYQYTNPDHYQPWYDYYDLHLGIAKDVEDEGSQLILHYHNLEQKPFENVVQVKA